MTYTWQLSAALTPQGAFALGWGLWWSWLWTQHSGRPEPPDDLSTDEARAAAPGTMGVLELGRALGLRGEA